MKCPAVLYALCLAATPLMAAPMAVPSSSPAPVRVGGNIKQTNFRVPDDFGKTHANLALNHAVLSYSEARVGVGIDWKLASFVTATVEAGYQPYRSFDFYRADVRYHENGSAPYGMISLHGAF